MKKLICALLVATMLLGSLVAFAGTTCQHKGGFYQEEYIILADGCVTRYQVDTVCALCDEVVGTSTYSTGSHHWVEEIHDGEPVEVCENCGKEK